MLESQIEKTKQQTRVPQLSASKRFGMYKKEEKKAQRKVDVKEEGVLAELLKEWRGFTYDPDNDMTPPDNIYLDLAIDFRSIRYSAGDIERLSIALAAFQDTEMYFCCKAGLFLSALVNSGKENEYIIHTGQFDTNGWLGYKNRKNIRIMGDGGSCLGQTMESGFIRVEGNSLDEPGICMTGGSIIICGNVYGSITNVKGGSIIVGGDVKDVGWYIEGGTVTVHGNVEEAGEGMRGGDIHVNGRIGSIGNVIHGRIFHRGKLIVDK